MHFFRNLCTLNTGTIVPNMIRSHMVAILSESLNNVVSQNGGCQDIIYITICVLDGHTDPRGLCWNPAKCTDIAFLRQRACEFRHLVRSLPRLLLLLRELSTSGALNKIWRQLVASPCSLIERRTHRNTLYSHMSIYDYWKEGDAVFLSPTNWASYWSTDLYSIEYSVHWAISGGIHHPIPRGHAP
jgi:hypothetical protein